MKQTLLAIKRQTNVTTKDLAARTGLSSGEVFAIEVGGTTTLANVEKVIVAFNQLSGWSIKIDDITYFLAPAVREPFTKGRGKGHAQTA